MSTKTEAAESKAAALLAKRSTEQLIIDLRTAEGMTSTPEIRMTCAWISDEITSRLPEVDALMDIYFGDDMMEETEGQTYGQLIERAIRELAAA